MSDKKVDGVPPQVTDDGRKAAPMMTTEDPASPFFDIRHAILHAHQSKDPAHVYKWHRPNVTEEELAFSGMEFVKDDKGKIVRCPRDPLVRQKREIDERRRSARHGQSLAQMESIMTQSYEGKSVLRAKGSLRRVPQARTPPTE